MINVIAMTVKLLFIYVVLLSTLILNTFLTLLSFSLDEALEKHMSTLSSIISINISRPIDEYLTLLFSNFRVIAVICE